MFYSKGARLSALIFITMINDRVLCACAWLETIASIIQLVPKMQHMFVIQQTQNMQFNDVYFV